MGRTLSKSDCALTTESDPGENNVCIRKIYPNGVSEVQKVERPERLVELVGSQKSKNVIGIDFGTSTLAVCFVTCDKDEIFKFKIHDEDVDYSTPTVLLIDQDNKVEIGSRALSSYTDLVSDVNKSIFFDKVKLELQHNKSVNRETTIKSSDGVEYYLVEVIAIILKKIKEKLGDFFKNRQGNHKIEDFHWALTVPALWGIRARDMMREAGYLAGLCSDHHDLPAISLQPAPNCSSNDITHLEHNPHRLSLVFEPEAAAVTCMEEGKTNSSIILPGPNDCYLTVDIGGGTIDITAHQVCEDGTLKILDIPHGRVYGGTEVNKKFKEFMGKFVFCDPEFSRYLEGDEHKEHCAQLFGFINQEFEKAKKKFGSNDYQKPLDSSRYGLHIPPSLIRVYKEKLEVIQCGAHDVSYKRSNQCISVSERKIKEFFEPNITAIKECIENALEKVGRDNVKIIYLVGSFGGCCYITSCIQHCYPNLPIVRPNEPEYAVAKGACLFYRKQVLRIADATYGTGIHIRYDYCNPIHKPAFKLVADDCEYCRNLFQPYIHKDDEIRPEIVYSETFTPVYEDQTIVSFTLYSTPDQLIDYVKKQDGSLPDNLEEIGCLKVNISSGMHLSLKKREVQLLLDFSSTEIHAYGWFIHDKDKTPVKVTCDFLSTSENVKKFTT